MTEMTMNEEEESPSIDNSLKIPRNREEGLQQYKTPNGMRLGVRPVPRTHLYEICWETGASIPGELKGRFTSVDRAVVPILEYLSKFWDNYERQVDTAKRERLRKKAAKANEIAIAESN